MNKQPMVFLNFHGFMGAPDNKNKRALAFLYPDALLLSPDINYLEESPKQILERMRGMVEAHREKDDRFILVGQSLGGFVAEQLSRDYALPCLLTNPCLDPHLCDVITTSPIPRPFLEEYRTICNTSPRENPRSFTLCTKTDEVLGAENFNRCQTLGGWLKEVKGGHSGIENLKEMLYLGVEEILKSDI